MKIVMFIPSLLNRGPIIVAKEIADNTFNKNIEYIFISVRKNDEETKKRFSRYTIYELGLKKFLLIPFELVKIMKLIKPDIIHCHCFWPTILSGIFLKKYKIVSTLHNNPNKDFLYTYGWCISKIMTRVMLFFQKRFKYNIAISNYIKDIYKEMGLDNVIVIYNGVSSLNRNRNILRTKSTLNLVTVSELVKIKNIYFLLDVVEKLKGKNIVFNFKIIGDGKEKKI